MAIYHFDVDIISRTQGRSAVACAAYRRAAKLYDEKANRTWNYENKKGVVYSEISVPMDAPVWAKGLVDLIESIDLINPIDGSNSKKLHLESAHLWNLVEQTEKRVDAQLSREIKFALPIELTLEQNIKLSKEFIHDQFVSLGMIADWNLHFDNSNNPHVHVMLTLRELTPSGFGKKVRSWNQKPLLKEWRLKWAEYANFYLKLHQHNVHIDHRSYKDQGIDLIPTVHLGRKIGEMQARGIETSLNQEANLIKEENLKRILDNPDILVKKIFASLEHHESVFTERDIAKVVLTYVNSTARFDEVMIDLKKNLELMYLGVGEDGRERYTTKRMFQIETQIQSMADTLQQRTHVTISHKKVKGILARYQAKSGKQLTTEQLNAVKHIVSKDAIACLVGRAGAGKSFSLGAANEIWTSQKLTVYGIALSGVAASGLKRESGINSRTIESFRYCVEKEIIKLTAKDVIVMDEAGMTDSISMEAVLKAVHSAKAKLVLMGDHAQLQPVGPGASFRALLERLGFAEINTIYRQRETWQKEATVEFAAGRVGSGLALYQKQGCVHLNETEEESLSRLVDDWFSCREGEKQKNKKEEKNKKYGKTEKKEKDKQKDKKEGKEVKEKNKNEISEVSEGNDLKHYLVMAYRNEDVAHLNSLIRNRRIEKSELAEGYSVLTESGRIKLSSGDRILFLKNNKELEIRNGYFATVKNINFTESGKIIDFRVILDIDGSEVCINPLVYKHFTHGYAATTHKAQGMTVNHTFVYAGGTKCWDRHAAYVSLSRHRDSCHLYADIQTHHNFAGLSKSLSRWGVKDSVLDYSVGFSERRGIKTNSTAFSSAQETLQRREAAKLVAGYVDANRDVGMAWQALKTKLEELGFAKMSYEPNAFSLIASTTQYQAMQESIYVRDSMAADIVKTPWRYQKAIEIHGLSIETLEKQSDSHAKRENVKLYAQLAQTQKTVLRDRQAAFILDDIKAHYPYLKNNAIDPTLLKKQAQAHVRRRFCSTLSCEEREVFKWVEQYQAVSREMGVMFYGNNDNKNKKDERYEKNKINENKIKKLSYTRDKFAHNILNHLDKADKSLDFFDIGVFKESEEVRKRSEIRWYKLQQSAARHAIRERIELYITTREVLSRSKIATVIIQDTKAHYGPMVDKGVSWKAIYSDVRVSDRLKLFETLDDPEKKLIRLSDRYRKINRRVGKVWSKILGKNNKKSDITLGNKLIAERNKLASLLLDQKQYVELNYFFNSMEETQEMEETEKREETDEKKETQGKKEKKQEKVNTWIDKNVSLNFDKLKAQAIIHKKQIREIQHFEECSQEMTGFLKQIIAQEQYDENFYEGWKVTFAETKDAIHPILKQVEKYRAVLRTINHTEGSFKNLNDTLHRFDRDMENKYSEQIKQNKQFNRSEFSFTQKTENLDQDQRAKIRRAQKIVKESRAIEGTLAERYLREHRGIQGDIPQSFRFHPSMYHFETGEKYPALVVISQNKNKETQAVQVIHLNKETGAKAKLNSAKLTYGVLSHGELGVLVSEGENRDIIAIAEGPETALSIKEAYPNWRIYAALGCSNFGRIPKDESTKKMLFCADNDGENSKSQKQLFNAAQHYTQKNIAVWQAMPKNVKQDFNDILIKENKEAVKEVLDAAVLFKKAEKIESLPEKTVKVVEALTGEKQRLDDLLKQYVGYQAEQTRLVNLMHTAAMKNSKESDQYAQQAIQNRNKMVAFAKEAIKNPEFQAEWAKIKNTSKSPIHQNDGLKKLCEKIKVQGLDGHDKQMLIAELHSKATSGAGSWNIGEEKSRREGDGGVRSWA